jgi:hypothetical protein
MVVTPGAQSGFAVFNRDRAGVSRYVPDALEPVLNYTGVKSP